MRVGVRVGMRVGVGARRRVRVRRRVGVRRRGGVRGGVRARVAADQATCCIAFSLAIGSASVSLCIEAGLYLVRVTARVRVRVRLG